MTARHPFPDDIKSVYRPMIRVIESQYGRATMRKLSRLAQAWHRNSTKLRALHHG